MALQLQVVPVEIATGIDTKTDPKKVTGKLISLINAIFQEAKALKKRFGYLANPQTILNGSSIASGVTISPYQNELVELDGKRLYSFSDQQSKWVDKGALTTASLVASSIVKNSRGQTTQDQAQHASGFQVFTWEDTAGGTYYSVIDTGSGQTIVNSVLLSANAYMAKPMAVGNYIVIIYFDTSSGSLKYQAINMATPTSIGSAVTIATNPFLTGLAANTCTYDICLIGTSLYIVYNVAAGFTVKTLNPSLTLSAATLLTGGGPNVAAFTDSSNNLWIAWYDLFNIRVAVYSSTFTSILAATTIENTLGTLGDAYYSTHNLTGIVIGTTASIFYESDQYQRFIDGKNEFFYGDYIRTNTCTITGTIGTPINVIRSLGIAGKPFVYSGVIYMLAVYDAERTSSSPGQVYDFSTESTCFLISSTGEIVAKVAQLNGGGISKKFIAPEVLPISANSFQFSYLFKDKLISNEGTVFTQTGINSAIFTLGAISPSKLEIGRTLLLGGGEIHQYDGATPTELNFHLYPELMTAWTGSVGGSIGVGSFEYQSLYEWTDNQGQINRSETSDPLIVDVKLLQISVSTTSGSAILDVNDVMGFPNIGGDFGNIAVNFLVTGAGIPATAVVQSVSSGNSPGAFAKITLNAAATASAGEVIITITPQFSVGGNTIDLQKAMTVNRITTFPVSLHINQAGSIFVSDSSNLQIGMFLADDPSTPAVGSFITSINTSTNEIQLNGAGGPIGYVINQVKYAEKGLFGTYTNGSNVITGVDPNSLNIVQTGQTVVGPDGSPYLVGVINVGAATVTIGSNYGGSTATTAGLIFMPAGIFIKPGQLIAGPGIPANIYVRAVTTTFPDSTTIELSDNANSTQSGNYIFTNLFANILSVPTIRATNKDSVSLALYRTQGNQGVLYRSTSVTNPILNDRTIDFSYISDGVADVNIVGNEQLYTTGGEVDNTSPPASSSFTTYKNRAVLIPDENRLTWWFSKQVIPGSPVEFSNDFTENIDSRGGAIKSIAAMDDKLIFFKDNNIFYITGEGPTPAGTQNDFAEPQLISSDVGCSYQRSIVLTPDGLMFQSDKGIYLLSRGMQVIYEGAEVEAFNTSNVTSALLMQDVNQVRFTLDSGVTLVNDYFIKQWSVFTNIAAVDACISEGIYNYLTSAGLVNAETPGTFTDNGSFIQMSLTTSWMSFAGLQGFQRVWRLLVLGAYKSPHTLLVNVSTDFDSAQIQNITIPVTSDPTVYQYRIHMKKQKCETMQFQIQDSQTSSFGEGLELSEITLEVGVKQGANKMSAGKSY